MLTICRASAGSGKTYKLTLEYLKLILDSELAYQHILAVTFTNKATDEMKRRIVEKLDVLAHHTAQSEYADELCTVLQVSLDVLQQKAHVALFRLLHDFSAFNISTIDRFFQQTTRSFTREIGLQGGYNLELDNNRVLSEAIDHMLFSLEGDDNKELLGWLVRFSQEKVEDGHYWDIRKDITQLAKELFRESYKQYSVEMVQLTRDKGMLQRVQQRIYAQRNLLEQALRECGTQAIALMQQNNLTPASFKGASRSPFFHFDLWAKGVVKEPTATFLKLSEVDATGWYTSKTDAAVKSAIAAAYASGLSSCVATAIQVFDSLPLYLTAVESGRYLYTLGILSDINRHIEEYAREHNLLLLSDTAELLNRIIDGSDTPFIYEKIGTYIEHFMVDEFQDTSKLQWENFYPLFRESLDNGHSNLVVGDVKQSIYRWRDSDWTLLNEQLPRAFASDEVESQILQTNWRSAPQVVHFNNTFFERATDLLQQDFDTKLEESTLDHPQELDGRIVAAYHDIYQQLPPKPARVEGHIKVQFIDQTTCDDWKESVLSALPQLLIELQQQGARLSDIAFLVRSNSEAAMIADTLLQCKASGLYPNYRFDLISDEALYVGSFPIIKLIVSILKYLHNPTAKLNAMLAAYEYATTHLHLTPSQALSSYFVQGKQGESLFAPDFQQELDELKLLPLFEMCERIFSLFPTGDSNESVFVQAFQDMVIEYTTRYASDLNSFLQWWDERGCRKTISTPNSQDAIRIYTIHKSKGLEFKVTILPFCEWDMDNIRHSSILWAPPSPELEIPLPVLPLKYGKALARTNYALPYFTEKMHNYIDNINLAYVAFTRAKESLLLFSPKPKSEERAVGQLSQLLYGSIMDSVALSPHYDPDSMTFEVGEAIFQRDSEAVESEHPTKQMAYRSVNPASRLSLRLYGQGFFNDCKARTYGNLMHDMLSRIYTPAHLDHVVQEAVLAGKLSHDEGKEIEQKLYNLITSPPYNRWFAPHLRVLNETEILQTTGSFYRPDRVVIDGECIEIVDYKFGQNQLPSHHRQVSRYMQLISQMGYQQVRGFLWYVELGEVVEI